MGWKHYQTVDHPKREPQVGVGLFGIRPLILHFKFNFPNPSNLQNFTFSQFTYPLRKKLCLSKNAQKPPKNLHKTALRWLMK